ncbi:hypothetical protein ACMFMF_002002 [Clarireedia jacksonii]
MKDTRSAIKSYEFAKALLKKPCHLLQKEGLVGRQRLGLAVSGGVDSMALAALCMRMNKKWPLIHKHLKIDPNLELRFRFTAFIVDHGLRDGSDEEALQVKSNLAELGIHDTKILKLSWKDHEGDPSKLPNLESLARKYRFQELGRACRDHEIDTLLLGHHADDQVETVLMRLAKGHRGRGLAGIKASSEIPECEGIYGVHESGRPVEIAESRFSMQGLSETQLNVESGGVRIYRPLLGFPKEKLVSSCKKLAVKWVTDVTNADRTLTHRNAIRHMYKKHKLPRALSAPRILALARHMQKAEKRREDVVAELLTKVRLIHFDTRRGTLRVIFPPISDRQVDRNTIAAMLLRRVVMWVTPHPSVNLLSLTGTAATTIFPSSPSESDTPPPEPEPKAFNAAGVFFRPLPHPETPPTTPSSSAYPPSLIWSLTRQPHPRFGRDLPPHPIPRLRPSTYNHPPSSRYFLYDNRIWLSIQNRMRSGTLLVRNFRPTDSPKMKSGWRDAADLAHVSQALKASHGDDRWRAALPLVVWKPASDDAEEQLVGLPTLDIRRPGFPDVSWSCAYRKVELRDLGLQGVRVEGVKVAFPPSRKVLISADSAEEACTF